MKPAAIVLHGPTSAGKSSIARALQECALVPAFHITLDAFVTMSRRRDMRSGDEQRLAHHIHCNNLKSTLSHLVETHFELVVDLVLRDEVELKACFDILSGRPTYLIGVKAPLDILERREHDRGDRGVGMAREQIDHPAFSRRYDLVIDTSTCTPEEGAVHIRTYIHEQLRLKRHPSDPHSIA